MSEQFPRYNPQTESEMGPETNLLSSRLIQEYARQQQQQKFQKLMEDNLATLQLKLEKAIVLEANQTMRGADARQFSEERQLLQSAVNHKKEQEAAFARYDAARQETIQSLRARFLQAQADFAAAVDGDSASAFEPAEPDVKTRATVVTPPSMPAHAPASYEKVMQPSFESEMLTIVDEAGRETIIPRSALSDLTEADQSFILSQTVRTTAAERQTRAGTPDNNLYDPKVFADALEALNAELVSGAVQDNVQSKEAFVAHYVAMHSKPALQSEVRKPQKTAPGFVQFDDEIAPKVATTSNASVKEAPESILKNLSPDEIFRDTRKRSFSSIDIRRTHAWAKEHPKSTAAIGVVGAAAVYASLSFGTSIDFRQTDDASADVVKSLVEVAATDQGIEYPGECLTVENREDALVKESVSGTVNVDLDRPDSNGGKYSTNVKGESINGTNLTMNEMGIYASACATEEGALVVEGTEIKIDRSKVMPHIYVDSNDVTASPLNYDLINKIPTTLDQAQDGKKVTKLHPDEKEYLKQLLSGPTYDQIVNNGAVAVASEVVQSETFEQELAMALDAKTVDGLKDDIAEYAKNNQLDPASITVVPAGEYKDVVILNSATDVEDARVNADTVKLTEVPFAKNVASSKGK